MKHPHLRGLRYANWARRSDIVQDTSIGDQLEVNNNFALEHDMIHVRDFILEASGSMPGARTDIPEVIDSCVRDKVDVLLLHDVSRLTRSGVEHGMKVLYDIKSEGIEPVFVRDDIPGGEWAAVFQTLLLFAANQFSKKLADTSARSSQLALEDDRIPVAKMTPYGLDRLVCSLDDKPLFRVRNLDGNVQQRLHPRNDTVIETFEPDEDGKRGFYSKQRTEKVFWIEGEKSRADRVRWMFTQFFVAGVGFAAIAHELNAMKIPSPNGVEWRSRTVAQILRNPAYTGQGLANSYTDAFYSRRKRGGEPQAANNEFKTMAKKRRPPRIRRPERDWYWRVEPYLKDFLPPDLKSTAEAYQREHLNRIRDGHVPKPGGDPCADSPYILKGILVTSDGEPMMGQGDGRGGRYYAIRHKRGVRRRLVRAEAVESAVLGILKEVLTSERDLHERILTFVKQESAEASALQRNIEVIRKDQTRLLAKIEFLIDRVSTETKQLTERKINEAEAELSVVNRSLREAEGEVPAALKDVAGTADAVVRQLKGIGDTLDSQSLASLHRLLGHVIEKLVINLDTFELEIGFRLPESSVWSAYESKGQSCKVATIDPKYCNFTTLGKCVPLPDYQCSAHGVGHQQRCWKCSRKQYMRLVSESVAA